MEYKNDMRKKDKMIAVRIDGAFKKAFEKKAKLENRKPAEKARMLMEEYVNVKGNNV